ncbi:hypothetical protein Tsubulata_026379 [Turnera subulata]|uniref:Cytochrome P450 n=1 Tax=Turnera subulata TaxID=218843 RepID=A0A9Q0FRG3_9ROSI|nr:hypothetical protein Tsubulata_026379 [Turnera subulata]
MASVLGNLENMVVLGVVIGLFVFLRGLIRNYDGSSLRKSWPLVGMMLPLLFQLHRFHEWCTEMLEANNRNVLFRGPWSSNMNGLLTGDPSNIHYIMTSNFSNFPQGRDFKEFFDVLGDGIFNSDSDMWKTQRKLAHQLMSHPLFHKLVVKSTHEKVEKGLIPVLEHVWEQGLVVDLQDLFQRFTFDATCLTVIGHDPGCLSISFPEVVFCRAVDDAQKAIFYRHVLPQAIWKLQKWLNVGQEKILKRSTETSDRIISEIISAKKEKVCKTMGNNTGLEDDNGQGIDLIASYIMEDAIVMGCKSSDDKFLRDTVLSLLVAGRETTSSALSWFFWLVSRNPHVEKKIIDELRATLQHDPDQADHTGKCRLLNVEVLKRLPYLHGAICESLRLYPPLPFNHKSPLKTDRLPSGHHVIPKMKIYISVYSIGRMSSIWGSDCLEFKPERWITVGGGIKHQPSHKFFAFGAGPRSCLGKNIAFLQVKAVAAAIIYNYKVQLVAGQTITPSISINLHMKHGMKVKLFKRSAS